MPAALQIENDALQLQHLNRVDAAEGLVEQQKARVDHQRAGDFHAPPLAAGEHVAAAAAHLFQAQLIEQALHGLAAFAGAHGQRFENRQQVLFHRQLAEDAGLLRQIADAAARALVHRQVGDVLIVHQDAPGIGADQPDDHVERRGFPRAVRAQQAHHFALLHEHRDIVHDAAAAIGLGDLPGFEFAHAVGAATISLLSIDAAVARFVGLARHHQPIIVGEVGRFLAFRGVGLRRWRTASPPCAPRARAE